MRRTIDLAHSHLEFAIRDEGIAQVGQFDRVGGVVDLTDDGAPRLIEAVIEVRRRNTPTTLPIDTDAKNDPQMSFLSASVERLEPSRYVAVGTLEFRGDQHPITLEVAVSGVVRDGANSQRVHVAGEASLPLNDWVKTWLGLPDSPDQRGGKEVRLTFNLELVTQEALREDYDLILGLLAHAT